MEKLKEIAIIGMSVRMGLHVEQTIAPTLLVLIMELTAVVAVINVQLSIHALSVECKLLACRWLLWDIALAFMQLIVLNTAVNHAIFVVPM